MIPPATNIIMAMKINSKRVSVRMESIGSDICKQENRINTRNILFKILIVDEQVSNNIYTIPYFVNA
tara:strand:+ start:195 stop:395 length:201 start_codon:yes stop_codon:yes gene_type:complete